MSAVRAQLYKPPMNWQRKFGERRPMRYIVANLVVFVPYIAGCVWLWVEQHHWLGLVAPPILLLLLYQELTSSVREVEIVREELVLRTFLRAKRVPRQDITSAAMSLDNLGKGKQTLVTVLHLVDGSRLPVNPPGVDQHELLETIQTWMQSSLAMKEATILLVGPCRKTKNGVQRGPGREWGQTLERVENGVRPLKVLPSPRRGEGSERSEQGEGSSKSRCRLDRAWTEATDHLSGNLTLRIRPVTVRWPL